MARSLVEWIKAQEAQGYSEEQVRQALINKGFKPKDVDVAIIHSRDESILSLDHLLIKKGKLFRALFYIITIIFSLQLLAEIAGLLISLQFISVIFPIIFAWTMINYVRKRDLYKILMTIFLLSPTSMILLLALPLIKSFLSIGNTPFYVFIVIYTLILGLFMAYMFSKVSETFKRYLMSSIIFSSLLGLIFAITNVMGLIILRLTENYAHLNGDTGVFGTILNLFNSEILDPNIAFCIALVAFNIPYIIFYSKRKDKDPKLALLYIIPILIYILLSVILRYIANSLVVGTF